MVFPVRAVISVLLLQTADYLIPFLASLYRNQQDQRNGRMSTGKLERPDLFTAFAGFLQFLKRFTDHRLLHIQNGADSWKISSDNLSNIWSLFLLFCIWYIKLKKIPSVKELSLKRLTYLPVVTYGHDLWAMAKTRDSNRQLACRGIRMGYLIERSQLSCFRHLTLLKVFLPHPTRRRPRGFPRTHCRDYISCLACECLRKSEIPCLQYQSALTDKLKHKGL